MPRSGREVRHQPTGWIEPREHDVVSRLTVLYRIVRATESIYSPAAAAADLSSSNPQLDDEASRHPTGRRCRAGDACGGTGLPRRV